MADSFYQTVTEAVRHFEQYGFESADVLQAWIDKIRRAAIDTLTPESVLNEELQRTLGGIYKRMVEDGHLIKAHKGAERFTIERLKPKLRTELDRRLMVSRNLIKLNRQAMLEKVTQRFAGWASSVPAGGSRAIDIKDTKDHIRKALTSLPFEERRVAIDQGHKFVAALNEIIAVDSGAIAVIWHSRHSPGYHNRSEHKARDGNVYLLRASLAKDKGLVKPGHAGYYDDITKFGEEIFCSCYGTWLSNLRDLPPEMLTKRGEESLAEARAKIAAMRA
jgi:hypothetical protein